MSQFRKQFTWTGAKHGDRAKFDWAKKKIDNSSLFKDTIYESSNPSQIPKEMFDGLDGALLQYFTRNNKKLMPSVFDDFNQGDKKPNMPAHSQMLSFLTRK